MKRFYYDNRIAKILLAFSSCHTITIGPFVISIDIHQCPVLVLRNLVLIFLPLQVVALDLIVGHRGDSAVGTNQLVLLTNINAVLLLRRNHPHLMSVQILMEPPAPFFPGTAQPKSPPSHRLPEEYLHGPFPA